MSESSVTLSSDSLAKVARAFPLLGRFRGGAPHGSGHINDTFVVIFDQAGLPGGRRQETILFFHFGAIL